MLVIELNEYNKELLEKMSSKFDLPNIKKILSWQYCETYTSDDVSSGYLDPWCQWVSVHTGKRSDEHQLKNLGEVPNENIIQIWEHWDKNNETSIIWGVMNGNRSGAERCKAFVPDPWTFQEEAFPKQLNSLISLPRYLSKNYLNPSKLVIFREMLRFLFACLKSTRPKDWFMGLKIFVRGAQKFKGSHLTLICFFEWFSSMAFLKTYKRVQPDHGILFLNLLAHAQHHYWTDEDPSKSPQLIYVIEIIENILGCCIGTLDEMKKTQNIMMLNAITQKNTNNEPTWILYVPKSHEIFLKKFEIGFSHVEPLMTNDAHVFFETEAEAKRGERRLKSLEVDGKPLLHVERSLINPKKCFYKSIFTKPLNHDAMLSCGNISLPFNECFSEIVKRTGRHIQKGDILSNVSGLPKILSIEKVFNYLK